MGNSYTGVGFFPAGDLKIRSWRLPDLFLIARITAPNKSKSRNIAANKR